jgi:phage tail tape-measure protein
MANYVAGNLVWKVTGDTSGFDKNVANSEKKIKSFETSISGIGKKMTLFATLPILGLGVAAVKVAGQIETQKVAFGKLLKDVDKGAELFEKLKKFSAETPLALEDITDASKNF